MPIIATDKGIERELIPAGNYAARCYKMIEIGTVQEQFGLQTKVRIGWELPTELKVFSPEKGSQPLVIDKEYTLSMNDKANLRKMLASWRGKDFSILECREFDITKLIGKTCMINIIHKPGKADPSKMYQEIGSVSPLPRGLHIPDQINPTFLLTYDAWDQGKYDSLPEFIQTKIRSSDEYQAMKNPIKLHQDESEVNLNDVDPVTVDELPF